MGKAIYAIILIIIIGIAGISYYYINKNKNNEISQTNHSNKNILNINTNNIKNLTFPLGIGAKLELNITGSTFVGPQQNETNETQYFNTTLNITILKYSWPFVNVSVEYPDTNANQTLPIFVLEAPKEYMGRNFSAPLSLPGINEGICINLTLKSNENNTYLYEGLAEIYNYRIYIRALYNSNGIINYIFFNVKSINPINNNIVNLTNKIEIINVTNISEIKIDVPLNWSCNPPLSSHLWFTWEGIYKVSSCKVETTSVSDLRSAIQNSAIVMFLNKGCPHCIKTWPNILEALYYVCNRTSQSPIYIVVIGGFMNNTLASYISNTMIQNGLTGYPAIAYFDKGFVRDKILGERSVNEIRVFLEKYYK